MNESQKKQSAEVKPTNKIPSKIFEYIKKNFAENFLVNINSYKDRKGDEIYSIDISHDNTLYHLKFNSAGVLIEKQAEPLLEFYDDGDYTSVD